PAARYGCVLGRKFYFLGVQRVGVFNFLTNCLAACRGVAQRQLLLGCSQSYPQIVWATATGIVHHPVRTRGGCSYAGGACMNVGAPPSVRRAKPEHRTSRYSHPGRVLLQEKRMLIVGAPPPVRRV